MFLWVNPRNRARDGACGQVVYLRENSSRREWGNKEEGKPVNSPVCYCMQLGFHSTVTSETHAESSQGLSARWTWEGENYQLTLRYSHLVALTYPLVPAALTHMQFLPHKVFSLRQKTELHFVLGIRHPLLEFENPRNFWSQMWVKTGVTWEIGLYVQGFRNLISLDTQNRNRYYLNLG